MEMEMNNIQIMVELLMFILLVLVMQRQNVGSLVLILVLVLVLVLTLVLALVLVLHDDTRHFHLFLSPAKCNMKPIHLYVVYIMKVQVESNRRSININSSLPNDFWFDVDLKYIHMYSSSPFQKLQDIFSMKCVSRWIVALGCSCTSLFLSEDLCQLLLDLVPDLLMLSSHLPAF